MEISKPMYNEYYNRIKEIEFIIQNRPAYLHLQENVQVIRLIVSLSVFYKRVIANINGATVFANTIFRYSEAESIKIGSYELTEKEKNRILAIIINFNSLTEKYEIPHDIITAVETRDMIRMIKNLKFRLEIKDKNKPDEDEPF